jgi:hypothetical protein
MAAAAEASGTGLARAGEAATATSATAKTTATCQQSLLGAARERPANKMTKNREIGLVGILMTYLRAASGAGSPPTGTMTATDRASAGGTNVNADLSTCGEKFQSVRSAQIEVVPAHSCR